VLKLTDDANAIDEALEFHHGIQWHFLNRTRFRGSEGDWEQQIPSGSPKSEVITILATLKLVQQCDKIVYGQSGFANLLVNAIKKPSLQKLESTRVPRISVVQRIVIPNRNFFSCCRIVAKTKTGLHFECDFSECVFFERLTIYASIT
jgi:hypothetical protein